MKLCLTVGVSDAPPLSMLPGTITAAHEMGTWARESGFITKVITDENNTPVTIERIRTTLLEMLPSNDEVELFILHFAGHGFRTGAEQNVWLPSDWHQDMRAISVEALKKQLYMRGIKSLTIFADACRSHPADIETADICLDNVLPRGPYEAKPPFIDRFNAAMDGQQAYMLKGDKTAPDRCVFSTVLLEGLCGLNNEAYDWHRTDCVIPESLALFTRARLTEIGKTYDLKCSPENTTDLPRDHAIYFQRGGSTINLPIPKWPAPSSPDQNPDKTNDVPKADTSHISSRIFKQHVEDSLLLKFYSRQPTFNLAVQGATPKKVWSTSSVELCSNSYDGGTYLVHVRAGNAIQILVEFEDGMFASAVVYAELITVISCNDNGDVSWTCTSVNALSGDRLRSSITTIKNFQDSNLTANQVDTIAMKLRSDKHADPTLGAIASYLYDYTGDVDSIRRMAFFYSKCHQPIPFDVAFMGLLAFNYISSYTIVAEIPSVEARPQSEVNNNLPQWVTRATHKRVGKVAGLWPWLRQGWVFVDEPESKEKAATEGLSEITKFLLPSQFSSFREQGGRMLIEKFHMEASK